MKFQFPILIALCSGLTLAGKLPTGLVNQIVVTEYQGKTPKDLEPPIADWTSIKTIVRADGASVFGIWISDINLTGPVGSSGPEMMLYLEENGRYKKACPDNYPCTSMSAMKTKSNGLFDIRIVFKYKGLPPETHILKFNGNEYREATKKK